ncbi:ABC transporter ATP-binding protein [Lentilactobacillus kefiri]|uniref:ABC transporter-like protein n=3 Tax=Lentilactobacillus kefiri TaxID=33962 RepID=A0A8E1RKU1_LENKE|nr:ATP-binding cassette domain-containing protein [Lentilactobacillus kefiri]KRL70160.1 ABC transporter-like protein [Lentilactobacillus parakefiri DSM 10551]KRM54120.1 ABC transporter-like protein [Lentilactobacillus kefiri DSM 20587 = JCM 5818]MCJ2160968.1 ATP-binding cassette domain-containing protein [Lentilactobacillus kefiri]MCP9368896.1 ATP-binding cassette domain-containing protein [Lentilactobacillus kefiri]MDH5108361.1 ATP-binding cassette domain-containing protein [Lentilactobacillu
MTTSILDIEHLSKSFGHKQVLKDVSFGVQAGHIIGLVGPNGAGKSTIMKAILGLFNYPEGKIMVDGEVVSPTSHQSMDEVGALIEYPGIYPFLTGYQHLHLFSKKTTSDTQVMDIVRKLRMDAYINRKAKTYSLGMKQKLGIALALVNNPRLVILDEPMNGLDPQSNKDLRNLILSYARSGTTFLISSHILSELEKLIDDIVVIDQGQIVYTQSMVTLESGSKKLLAFKTSDDVKASHILAQHGYQLDKSGGVSVIENGQNQMADMINLLTGNGINIEDVQHVHNDLETILLNLLKDDQVKGSK